MEKSATREWGFLSGSSCRIGTKKTFFRLSSRAIFSKFADIASLDANVISSGLFCRRCALALMHTAVSVIPWESFARVFPVQGAMISASKGEVGPNRSATGIVWTISLPHIFVT